MNVLLLANNDAGLYRFRRELLIRLAQDYQVHVASPFGSFVDELKELGCILHETKFDWHGMNPISEYKLYKQYKNIIREVNPRIVFTYTIKPNVYGGCACARLKVPCVANVTGLGSAVTGKGIVSKVSRSLYKIGLKNAQKVFFQNSHDRDFMINQKIVTGQYDLLPGSGVNLEENRVLPYPDDEKINFAFISRVIKEKGADQFIEAAKTIQNKYPNTRFLICGNCDDEYKSVVSQLNDSGVIEYHGFVKDMKSIQAISSCTVHPTYYAEGMSNVLLESCACGRPIITTDRPGCREAVDDGVNGYLIKEKNSQDLIEKIEQFLALSWEQRKNMGLAGRKKVEREFNRNIVIDKYLSEIR